MASLIPTPIKRTRRRGDLAKAYLKTETKKKLPLLTAADEAKARESADAGSFEGHIQRDWCFEHPMLSQG